MQNDHQTTDSTGSPGTPLPGSRSAPLSRLLRRGALAVLLLGVAVWAFGGARLGWTQTSTVTLQHDEITGIDYPVREPAFRPGVEFPLGAAGLAGLLGALGLVLSRRDRRESEI